MSRKSIFAAGAGVLFFVSIFFFGGCADNNPASTQPLSKNSSVVLKTGIKSNQTPSFIPASGGSLELTSANFNLEKLAIQENSGFDGEQQGENQNENGGGGENEASDIIVNGPLNFDIANGDVSLGNLNVYPGTFKKVDIYFTGNNAVPFNGNSIFVTGNFTKSDGTVLPFEIRSSYNSMYETLIANGGITVLANQSVEVKLTFDLVSLFGNLDLNNAVVTGNVILIDSSNNANILSVFETNLRNSIDLEENH